TIDAVNLIITSPEGKTLAGPLNFSLAAGERAVLVGRSGSGKRQTGDALLTNGDSSRPVRASDISVLVRSRREAALIRDALTLLA
ncbi:hypothetical protein MJM04_34145, partial [Salmonella enterica subsp. enterica serovar Cerro]|nr:hypothetical protein [Salmonella enterica subsp. enterica serovar Cerro]